MIWLFVSIFTTRIKCQEIKSEKNMTRMTLKFFLVTFFSLLSEKNVTRKNVSYFVWRFLQYFIKGL